MQRKWLVEDNLVTLYIAKHKYKDLNYKLKDIEKILALKAVQKRIGNFIYIHTNGKSGLSAGGPAESWKQLYQIFKDFDQKKFAELVNLILEVKLKVTMNKDETNQNDSQKDKG